MVDNKDAQAEVVHEINFPMTDEAGTVWIDSSGIYDKEEHSCFICSEPTHRLDLNFGTHFCDSVECNLFIDRLLTIDWTSLAFDNSQGNDKRGSR